MNTIQAVNNRTPVFNRPPARIKAAFVLLLSILCLDIASANAKDYKVELLVFENLMDGQATESHTYTEPQEMTSGASTWTVRPTMLLNQAAALEKSDNYRIIKHYSWGQESRTYNSSATFTVAEPRLQGWVKIYADNLLFANLDLDFNGYRMIEKRRLKLNEKHYFDHPRFGVLMQVSRLAVPELEELPDFKDKDE